MAGVSTRMKRQRGLEEQRARELQASIERQKAQAHQDRVVASLVSEYQISKDTGSPFGPTYYPLNPNYEPGFRIPQVDRNKEGYISISAIKGKARQQELERLQVAELRAKVVRAKAETLRLKQEAKLANDAAIKHQRQLVIDKKKAEQKALQAKRQAKIDHRRKHFADSKQYAVTIPKKRPKYTIKRTPQRRRPSTRFRY